MDEAGTRDPNARGATTALFVAWKSRTDRAGEPTAAMEQLISNIEDRGLSPERRNYGCGFVGLKREADLCNGRLISVVCGETHIVFSFAHVQCFLRT